VSGTRRRSLHPSERKYLLAAARGLTAQQTARHYSVSVNTVNTTLARAKAALDASNIVQAVVFALAYGDFTIPDTLRPIDMDPKD
jgi:DNA-binding CsgD family transcriptional regulator